MSWSLLASCYLTSRWSWVSAVHANRVVSRGQLILRRCVLLEI